MVSFSLHEQNRNLMISLIDSISSNRSIMKLYILIKGRISKKSITKKNTEEQVHEHLKENEMGIFPICIITQNYKSTIETVIQSETIGNLSLNTVLIDYDDRLPLHEIANISSKLRKNFLILRNKSGITNFHKIDVWWSSPTNGNLALMIAHLVTLSRQWKEHNPVIRVFNVVAHKNDYHAARERLHRMVTTSRIENVECNVIVKKKDEEMSKIISKNSSFADLVIIGFSKLGKVKADQECLQRIREYTNNLNASLIVSAHYEIDFKVN